MRKLLLDFDKINSDFAFEKQALKLFKYQYEENKIYNSNKVEDGKKKFIKIKEKFEKDLKKKQNDFIKKAEKFNKNKIIFFKSKSKIDVRTFVMPFK